MSMKKKEKGRQTNLYTAWNVDKPRKKGKNGLENIVVTGQGMRVVKVLGEEWNREKCKENPKMGNST